MGERNCEECAHLVVKGQQTYKQTALVVGATFTMGCDAVKCEFKEKEKVKK